MVYAHCGNGIACPFRYFRHDFAGREQYVHFETYWFTKIREKQLRFGTRLLERLVVLVYLHYILISKPITKPLFIKHQRLGIDGGMINRGSIIDPERFETKETARTGTIGQNLAVVYRGGKGSTAHERLRIAGIRAAFEDGVFCDQGLQLVQLHAALSRQFIEDDQKTVAHQQRRVFCRRIEIA